MAGICRMKKILFFGTRLYSSCISLNDVYIISAMRTPIGCFQGNLRSLTAVQLATKALIAAIEKAALCKDDIQEIIMGCAFPVGLGLGPAHQVATFSGLPSSVIASVVGKACGSGFKAVIIGCQAITSNTQEVVAAGGMESMTNIPYILRRKNMRLGNICLLDLIFHDALIDVYDRVNLTQFAEDLVKEYKYTREDMDNFALESYAKASQAQEMEAFKPEMVPIPLSSEKDEEVLVCADEQVNRLDKEKLRTVKPELGKDGTVTPANSSGIHDGAAMVILASGNYVLKKNLTPLARIVSYAEATVETNKFVISPSIAIAKALLKANLKVEDIERWEINETFALTTMLNTKILQIDPNKVNLCGGAISLGHPFGMTGVRLIGHLAHVLQKGEFGCASMCHGPGGGVAVIIEKF